MITLENKWFLISNETFLNEESLPNYKYFFVSNKCVINKTSIKYFD